MLPDSIIIPLSDDTIEDESPDDVFNRMYKMIKMRDLILDVNTRRCYDLIERSLTSIIEVTCQLSTSSDINEDILKKLTESIPDLRSSLSCIAIARQVMHASNK